MTDSGYSIKVRKWTVEEGLGVGGQKSADASQPKGFTTKVMKSKGMGLCLADPPSEALISHQTLVPVSNFENLDSNLYR
jgi:hypothetical protein